MRKENIYDEIEKNIMNTKMDEVGRNTLLKNLMRLKNQKLNIMVTGGNHIIGLSHLTFRKRKAA